MTSVCETPLGKRLRAKRLSLGWTLQEAAKEIGIASTSLSEYERYAMPSLRVACKIAKAYGTSIDWIATGQSRRVHLQ